MAIQIHNSLSRNKEELKAKTVRMYSCGVTVYDQCHIGHARSLYVFDVIRRYLKYRGYDVKFVRNITDIDDKIINKARELNTDWAQVVRENIAAYKEDLKALEVNEADEEPRATENISEMIKHIEGLIEKGFAYAVEGDVYFQVRQFKEYGKLSGQSVEKMLEAVRISKDEKKRDPLDFALWKKSKEGEPSWDSPWGKGRPGWHIECSCMSMKYLQCETLDIHAGGRDLIFPHHENEIAQSEALTGKPFAKYWIHHGLLTINAQKMSKSLGNFITIHDAIEKYGVNDLKMFFLSSHYSSSIDFSDERMQEAHKALERLDIFFRMAQEEEKKEVTSKGAAVIKKREDDFLSAMDDDFNTPRALGSLYELISDVYKLKEEKDCEGIVCLAKEKILQLTENIFGLKGLGVSEGLPSEDVKALLQQRQEARVKKDFKKSDELRDILIKKGIVVEDTPQGQRWRKG